MQMTTGVTIANGASQSNVLDLTDQVITGIAMPAAWTGAAKITLLAADEQAGTYQPVHDAAGVEYQITTDAARHVYLDPAITRGLRYVKLRSGVTATPVNQGAARTFTVTVERSGGG